MIECGVQRATRVEPLELEHLQLKLVQWPTEVEHQARTTDGGGASGENEVEFDDDDDDGGSFTGTSLVIL